MPEVVAAHAAMLTGGTDVGVIRQAGRARREQDAAFPLVGVVPETHVEAAQELVDVQASLDQQQDFAADL